MQIALLRKTPHDQQLLAIVRAALSAKAFLNAELTIEDERYQIESYRVRTELEIVVYQEKCGEKTASILSCTQLY
jgi:hypothetical protein